jgi:acetyltransferase-like isoleucine patch superfamily enzyme
MKNKILYLAGLIINKWGVFSSKCITEFYKKRISSCGKDVRFYSGVTIVNPETVIIGDHTHIGENCHLRGGGKLMIGSWCQIANNSIIITGVHQITGDKYYRNNAYQDVTIGNNVWIASGAIILPGVEIGDNSVIAAGAVVSRSVAANVVVAGVPARVIGTVPDNKK